MERELKTDGASVSEKEIIRWIEELVARPSHSGVKGQETATAAYIHDLFQKEGISSELIPVADGRCNVVARLEGRGGGRSLLFTGHTDTVPPYEMAHPYEVIEEKDRLYGRGTVDMKGPLACMIAAMVAIKREGAPLKGDLVFGGVIDEEAGSLGTIALLEQGIEVDAAIIGEPTDFGLCLAHRGLEWYTLTIEGKTVHGGNQAEGVNAILHASELISRLQREISIHIEKTAHPIIGKGSINFGTIHGGTQPSTVAGECVITFDRRWLPGETHAEITGQIQAVIEQMATEDPTFKCRLEIMPESVMKEGYVHAPMSIDPRHPLVGIATDAVESVTELKARHTYFPAWSDGGLFDREGIPTIVLAPGKLSSAHSTDEHIPIAHLVPGMLVYKQIAQAFCNEPQD